MARECHKRAFKPSERDQAGKIGAPAQGASLSIEGLVSRFRRHVDLDFAFVSRFANGRRYFLPVDSDGEDCPIAAEACDRLEDSHCQRVVDGRLPEPIGGARAVPEAAALPVTFTPPVGAHLSVPIRMEDGSVFCTFCCFSRAADPTLSQRGLSLMRTVVALIGERLGAQMAEEQAKATKRARIAAV